MDKEKLRKIKALAEGGVGGEAINAQKLFLKLCAEAGVDPDSINTNEEPEDWFFIKCYFYEKDLLKQVLFTGANKSVMHMYFERGWHFQCTKPAKILIDQMWSVYRDSFNKQLEVFTSAFIMKNEIYPTCPMPDDEEEEKHEYTEEEIERIHQAYKMSNSINREEIRLAIEEKTHGRYTT